MIHMQLVFGRLCKISCSRQLVECDNYVYDNVYMVSCTFTYFVFLQFKLHMQLHVRLDNIFNDICPIFKANNLMTSGT
jgi:TRAP-type mannitol/chloroaromatic compound transport system permease small subunit